MASTLKGGRLSITAAAGIVGLLCMSTAALGGFASSPAKGVDLSGRWQLNAELSDDARKIMDEANSKIREEWRRRHQSYRRNLDPDRDLERDVRSKMFDRDPYVDFGFIVEASKLMTLSQTAGELIIKDDNGKVRYQAGSKSVVSFGKDAANRSVGWNGRTFVVATHALDGQQKEERYWLDKNGRLVVTLQMNGRDLPKVLIKRVYDRSNA